LIFVQAYRTQIIFIISNARLITAEAGKPARIDLHLMAPDYLLAAPPEPGTTACETVSAAHPIKTHTLASFVV
jgi:hypothetical protein